MTRAQGPCTKDCPNRCAEPNCHMTCEAYLAYQTARRAELDAIQTKKQADRIAKDFEAGIGDRNRVYWTTRSHERKRRG